jgi:hypothetical protein
LSQVISDSNQSSKKKISVAREWMQKNRVQNKHWVGIAEKETVKEKH